MSVQLAFIKTENVGTENLSVDSIGGITFDEYCIGTAVDNHWILTTASCCMDNVASTPHGRVYANFGSAVSSMIPSGEFSSNDSGRFLSKFYSSSGHYISIFDICHDPWLLDTIQHIS